MYVLQRCTHPRFQCCEIHNIHAAQSDMTCVSPASLHHLLDIPDRSRMARDDMRFSRVITAFRKAVLKCVSAASNAEMRGAHSVLSNSTLSQSGNLSMNWNGSKGRFETSTRGLPAAMVSGRAFSMPVSGKARMRRENPAANKPSGCCADDTCGSKESSTSARNRTGWKKSKRA